MRFARSAACPGNGIGSEPLPGVVSGEIFMASLIFVILLAAPSRHRGAAGPGLLRPQAAAGAPAAGSGRGDLPALRASCHGDHQQPRLQRVAAGVRQPVAGLRLHGPPWCTARPSWSSKARATAWTASCAGHESCRRATRHEHSQGSLLGAGAQRPAPRGIPGKPAMNARHGTGRRRRSGRAASALRRRSPSTSAARAWYGGACARLADRPTDQACRRGVCGHHLA